MRGRARLLLLMTVVAGTVPAQDVLQQTLQRVREALERGQRGDAERILMGALAESPSGDARQTMVRHWLLGAAALDAQLWQPAIDAWTRVCAYVDANAAHEGANVAQAHLRRAQALAQKAQALLATKRLAAVPEVLQSALTAVPEPPASGDEALALYVLSLVGQLAFDDNLTTWKTAAAAFGRAVRLYEMDPPRDAAATQRYLQARANEAFALGTSGDYPTALTKIRALVAHCRERFGDTADATLRRRQDLGYLLRDAGDLDAARAEATSLYDALKGEARAADDEIRSATRRLLASVLQTMGLREEEKRLWREEVAALGGRGADDLSLLQAREALAMCVRDTEGYAPAYEIMKDVLAGFARVLHPHDPNLSFRHRELGWILAGLGRLDEGLQETARAIHILEQSQYPKNTQLWAYNLKVHGELLVRKGELERGLALEKEAAEILQRVYAGGNVELLFFWTTYAVGLQQAGRHADSAAVLQRALDQYLRHSIGSTTRWSGRYMWAQQKLAIALQSMGDLPAALRIHQHLVDVREALGGEGAEINHQQLASIMAGLGDFAGALPLYRRVLELRRGRLPADSIPVAHAKLSLGYCLTWLGQRDAAASLYREALPVLRRGLGEAAANVLTLRGNLAYHQLEDDPAAARVELEDALRIVRVHRPQSWQAAWLENLLGKAEARLGHWQKARDCLTRTIPAMQAQRVDHIQVPAARRELLFVLSRCDDREALGEAMAAVLEDALARLGSVVSELAPRGLREACQVLRRDADALLSLSPPAAGVSATELFELLETLRSASQPQTQLVRATSTRPEVEAARGRLCAAQAELAHRTAPLLALELDAATPDAAAIATARRAVDQAHVELMKALGDAGFHPARIDVNQLARRLPPGSAAVAFHRYSRQTLRAAPPHRLESADHYVAFVVGRRSREVRRIELGAAGPIDAVAAGWRAALGAPLRGEAPAKASDPRSAGTALRGLVLDQVLAEVAKLAEGSKVERLYLCLDDALHALPLHALPHGRDQVQDDVYRFHYLVSFDQLSDGRRPASTGPPTLLAVGGIDFNVDLDLVRVPAVLAGGERAAAGGERSTAGGGPGGQNLRLLPGSREEARSLAELFRTRTGQEPWLLEDGAPTKERLQELAPNARYLHVATHGWFLQEAVRSLLDRAAHDEHAAGVLQTVIGLAPLNLCGLALAGANQGRDAVGRMPGVLTAEELSGWDLRACQLAVLSACETNVGLRRAGQGIQSLQTALHGAGARVALTSLWKVRDDATRDLMSDFYTNLLAHGDAPDVALRKVLQGQRKRGAPLADWAAWILSGDPR